MKFVKRKFIFLLFENNTAGLIKKVMRELRGAQSEIWELRSAITVVLKAITIIGLLANIIKITFCFIVVSIVQTIFYIYP